MPARGVSIEQDPHFKDKEKVLLQTSKFPSVFSERVDMSKVSVPVMRPWIATRVEQMLGFEDEVLVEFIVGLLEAEQYPDPRKMQIALTGFLEKRAPPFMHELWGHLLSAQVSVGGVPRAFVEQKKREMQAQREEHASMMDQVRTRGPRGPDRAPPPDRRWDRGRAPVEADRRRDVFVDKRGNVTRRERDNGWGRRAPPADRSPPRYVRDEFGRDVPAGHRSRSRSPLRRYEREDSPRYSPPPPASFGERGPA
ncbi:hypothetical protein MCAP1_001016 [Malassezia caprae]|uniref:PWI domain-containing protein n=1 Tax=Malassezia caprae TaxID=1381934 RepID=A0AAF0IZA0_9BASI|nr:hypothetical protein MCAP1_001016 [Malassezia caprae]